VLKSCTKAGVATVVQTSSVVAVYGDLGERGHGHKFTEEDWCMYEDPKGGRGYSYSKKMAEETCVNYAKDHGSFKLLHVNPGLVVGPSISGRMNGGSMEFLHTYLSGKNAAGAGPFSIGLVDVRDVAWAHISAAFNPAAEGRYIACAKTMTMLEVGQVLSVKYKKQPKSVAPKCLLYILGPLVFGVTWQFLNKNMGLPLVLDNSKIQRDLITGFTDVEESLIQMADAMVDQGLVKAVTV